MVEGNKHTHTHTHSMYEPYVKGDDDIAFSNLRGKVCHILNCKQVD